MDAGSRLDADGIAMKPFVSVLIPCRDEGGFLARCLDSILACDYPADRMEVLVIDGSRPTVSGDAAGNSVEEVSARYVQRDARVRRVENPAGTTPAALNRGIEASRGDVLARIDAHSSIAPEYLSRAVDYLASTGADNVGGPMETISRDRGVWAEPIARALTHPFGVGNSRFRTGAAEAEWVDTVFGGCWRREVFTRIGKFNERLERGQDLEFNLRLRRRGGKILIAPDVASRYYARSTLTGFWRHNWTNGVWAVLPFAYCEGMPIRWRHLAPLGLIVAAGFAPWIALVYTAANLAVSAHVAFQNRSWRLLGLMPVVFSSLHLPYGAGSVWGLLRLMWIFLARRWGSKNQLTYDARPRS